MRDSLNDSKAAFDMSQLIAAAKGQADGSGERPVDKWHPEHCGAMDMVIKSDGTWWHEGSMITRLPLVKLFASILRKDEDGVTYLVTPVEKIEITVDKAHFLATALHVDEGDDGQKRFIFTTNVDETIALSPERPLIVETHPETLEPTPCCGCADGLMRYYRGLFFTSYWNMQASAKHQRGFSLVLARAGSFTRWGQQLSLIHI